MTGQLGAERTELGERTLLAQVARGDRAAFERLYREYHPRLLHFLTRMLASRTAAEEALNDTMLVVWRRAESFNGSSKVSTWIFGIAYRSALKALRQSDPPVEIADPEALVADEAPGPETTLIARQEAVALRDLLITLPADQRSVVELTYFHDFSYREIAEVLACPVDTVKTRMFHARRKLRSWIEAQKERSA